IVQVPLTKIAAGTWMRFNRRTNRYVVKVVISQNIGDYSDIIDACSLATYAPCGFHAGRSLLIPISTSSMLKVDGFRALAHINNGHGAANSSRGMAARATVLPNSPPGLPNIFGWRIPYSMGKLY